MRASFRNYVSGTRWELENEYRARRDGDIDGFAAYLAQEQRVFDELNEKVYATVPADEQSAPSRYTQDSPFNSKNHATNWNRTVELIPETPIGSVLMLHGLTDSPYSMRSTAELFHARGYYVLALRLPGHGTVPAALRHASSEDWQAVIEPAARHVRSVIDNERPFFVVGYSNGGALAVNYALDALNDDSLPLPDRLMLMSPAIGVAPYAMFATWHKSLSWLTYFEKFQWQAVLPEYDPYKYNSFPKNAGHETYALTQQVQEKLSRIDAAQTCAALSAGAGVRAARRRNRFDVGYGATSFPAAEPARGRIGPLRHQPFRQDSSISEVRIPGFATRRTG